MRMQHSRLPITSPFFQITAGSDVGAGFFSEITTMNYRYPVQRLLVAAVLMCGCGTGIANASTGGVGLKATRMIYPLTSQQEAMGVVNTSRSNVYLIQSWITDSTGKKTRDFIVVPPLFVLKQNKEGTLRINLTPTHPLPTDRESVYYLNSKAIPSLDESPQSGKSTLKIATQSIIKVFVRPEGLPVTPDKSFSMLICHNDGNILKITNSSPYYVSLVNITTGGKKVKNLMVPPLGDATESSAAGGIVKYQAVNDYGSTLPAATCKSS